MFALAFTGNITGLAAPTESLAWRVEYDDQGRISKRINPAGQATRYSYDNASDGSLRSVTANPPEGAPVTWRFDMAGRLQSMRDAEGEIAYRYDDRGRLASVERMGSSAIRYSYDDAGRLAELKVGDFYHVGYKYDFLGRLSALDTNAGIIHYEYQTGQNTVVRTLPNGVKTFWKRQPNGVLEKITHGFFKKPDDTQYSVLAQYAYVHGPDKRIMSISEKSPHGSGVHSFGYDTMGRLTKATGLEGEEYHYEYDLVGNRTRATATGRPDQVCTSDWAGRLTSFNGTPCRHDAAGNLTEVADGGKAREYRYHPSGQLAEVGFGGSSVKYRYDGNGRLVVRQTAKGVMRFTNDPFSTIWQPLIIEEDGGVRTLVIWDGSSPLALVRNGRAEFLLQDHLGSVRQVVDGSGSVIRKMDYDPFGTMNGDNLASALHPGFAGLFWDAEAGTCLTLARGYAPELGSFTQPDPQKQMPSPSHNGLSLYAYCGGDPMNQVDRDGKAAEKPDPPFVVYPNILNLKSLFKQSDDDGFKSEGGPRLASQQQIQSILKEYDGYRNEFLNNKNIAFLDMNDLDAAANKYAWKKFSDDHSGVPGAQGKLFGEISNLEADSMIGRFNFDWSTSLNVVEANPIFRGIKAVFGSNSPSRTGLSSSDDTYFFWKDLWIKNREEP
ncbi:MAG: RHS repeat-associated core domain-containing protein, partial [Verrucomicrobiaceae bacterium]